MDLKEFIPVDRNGSISVVEEIVKQKPGVYYIREKLEGYEREIGFQTHAELVAYINHIDCNKNGGRELTSIESDRPQIF